MRRYIGLAALVLVALLASAAACGDDDGDGPRDSSAQQDAGAERDGGSGELPEACVWDADQDERCDGVPGKPLAAVCQGAPAAMILTNNCDYMTSIVGTGNLYCCP